MWDATSLVVVVVVVLVVYLLSHVQLLRPHGLDSCDTMDYSSPGSAVHEIIQAIILEWVAVSFLVGP